MTNGKKTLKNILYTALFGLVIAVIPTEKSFAGHGGCGCGGLNSSTIPNAHEETQRRQGCDCAQPRIDAHNTWFLDNIWTPLWLPAMQGSSAQQSLGAATGEQASQAVMDARNNVDTVAARQVMTVQTQVRHADADYEICTPASIIQSMGSTYTSALGASVNIVEQMNIGNSGSTAGGSANGPADDQLRRFERAASTYCDPTGGGGTNALWCGAANPALTDLDTDFMGVYFGRNLDDDVKLTGADFNADKTLNSPEEMRAAADLKKNLGFGAVFQNFTAEDANDPARADDVAQLEVLKRQFRARQSVALHPFANFEAMFMPGSNAATQYLRGLYEDMGVDPALINVLISDNPSLYKMMEVSFHDYHANPNTIVRDYTGDSESLPRFQAIGLDHANMQFWNIYNSLLRIDQITAGINQFEQENEYFSIQADIAQINR